jgi:hypothetical protein
MCIFIQTPLPGQAAARVSRLKEEAGVVRCPGCWCALASLNQQKQKYIVNGAPRSSSSARELEQEKKKQKRRCALRVADDASHGAALKHKKALLGGVQGGGGRGRVEGVGGGEGAVEGEEEVCVCVCVCVCINMYICMYMYAFMYVYIDIYVYRYIDTYRYM